MSPSTTTTISPDVNRILTYWFEGENLNDKWFKGTTTTDAEIKEQFGHLVLKARDAQLDSWKQQPEGTLALIILIDQFPRNLYRGSPLSFSSDQTAKNVAVEAIAKGFDRQVGYLQQMFFYMPLMHDESLLGQVAALGLYESLLARCVSKPELVSFMETAVKSTKSHLECVLKFGRFPGRNEALGRVSTSDEIEYLRTFNGLE